MGRKSFASSTQITLSALLESSVLPAKTHITGNFKQFKPATLDPKVDDSTGQIRKPEPRIGIGLLCEVSSDGTLVSDYSAQRANPSILVMVNITLWPKDVRSGDEVGEEIKDMLRDSMTELGNSMGRTAKIAVDYMTVVAVTRGKEIVVDMRGDGERMFKVKGRESIKLLKGECFLVSCLVLTNQGQYPPPRHRAGWELLHPTTLPQPSLPTCRPPPSRRRFLRHLD